MKTRNTVRALAKGIKVGALGTLLATSTLGCGMEATNDQNQEQTQGGKYELDSYKFARYDFLPDLPDGRERVRLNPALTDQQNVFQIMDNLEAFIKTEVTNVNNELRRDISYPQNDLQNALVTTFPTKGQLSRISENISNWYINSSEVFAQIINQIRGQDNKAKFRACYDMLADRAYRDSLHLQDFNLPFQEVPADQNLPEMQAALSAVGIDANDYQQIENEFERILSQVAGQNGLRTETLQNYMDYSLLIESLYGVEDYLYKGFNGTVIPAKPERVNETYYFGYRINDFFNSHIDRQLAKLQANNLTRDAELVR
ncbi:MAG: hypothetical protein K2H09_08195 [Treponemataceae bacterium]|nr:hypothetical protein [Treponemataceae bacterium]